MSKPIRILLVEDREVDAERILQELKRAGFDPHCKRVACASEYMENLTGDLEVILSDYALPGFDGMIALELLRNSGLNVPFILVSGPIGEDVAAAAIAKGATDYVAKDRLGRLPLTVTSALEQKRLREQHRVLEEQLRQSQKMEVFGRLAAGIAHDFNNLLTVIGGYCRFLLDDIVPSDPRRRDLEEIQKATERAIALTRQFLAFGRRQKVRLRVLSLNSVIAEIVKMLLRLISEDIRLVTRPAANLKCVRSDPGQIAQVLMNLTINACDAMPDGGTLTIKTENVHLKEGEFGPGAEMPRGECVLLTVTDTGTGMPETVKAQIFEPFFTTKQVADRSGLGLATCYEIIKQSGGHIAVRSEVGGGTTFRVYLPCADESSEQTEEPVDSEPARGRGEMILLVEDEAAVREIVALTLKRIGYQVDVAADGEDAFRIAQTSVRGAPELVIIDLIMPGMGGRNLASIMRARFPQTKILFTSGYPNTVLDDVALRKIGAGFIAKPLVPAKLARKVRTLLDQ